MMGPQDSIHVQDLFSLHGKVALVTGGSRGIGLMIARGYLESGAKVYISSRKKEVCDETARQLSEIGVCVSLPADLSAMQGCTALAEQMKAREERLHILVNNAGVQWSSSFADFPEEGWDKVMDTNAKGVFFLTQQMLPLLEKGASAADPARIINIGSNSGIRVLGFDNYSYTPSKAAVHHMTRVLAVELGPRNITVNAIAPGPFESKMTKWILDNRLEEIVAGCPLRRIGTPSDMAGTAIYLASRAGAYVNGMILALDGGTCVS
jgi:NAD(P)-dependent dehydrogenase (short-subunit alcohol dehydrogenase family)